MRKGRDGDKKKWEIMMFIVATKVVASRPPKRQPLGTPHVVPKQYGFKTKSSPKLWGKDSWTQEITPVGSKPMLGPSMDCVGPYN